MWKLSLLLLTGCLVSVTAATRPNVVVILADDLGWSDTTLYGKTKFYKTPNLERLAKRGMTFSRAYSASPVCSASRAGLLTGLSPARTGFTASNGHGAKIAYSAQVLEQALATEQVLKVSSASRLPASRITLAESLKEQGYATGHFGKWHLGATPSSPLQQGFDVDCPHWAGMGPGASYVAPWSISPSLRFWPRFDKEHFEDRMAAEAVAWMEKHKNQPFFLNYWSFSVHAPYNAKKELIEKYRQQIDPNDAQRCPTFAAMIESLDDAVGTLLDALDRLGIADNTVIVFTSDNGGNMRDFVDGVSLTSNRPLRGGKATVFEGGLRVPCIISWPQVTAPGTRSDALIQSLDFVPTLLDLLAIPPPPDQVFDGVSIAKALKGLPLERQAIFSFFPHKPKVPDALPACATVTTGDWKLIRLFHHGENGGHGHLLFHLKEDIGETNDLSEQEPERVKQMDALIEDFLRRTNAEIPRPNPRYDPKAPPVIDNYKEPLQKKRKAERDENTNDFD